MSSKSIFENKKILLGITGGIAAYKIPDFVSSLIKKGAEVRTIMTPSAEKFVTRLSLETVSGNECIVEMFPPEKFYATHHIDWADWADVFIIAPATANIIGKFANGIADDLLSTINLAVTAPKVIAPAMNVHMWENSVVQDNISYLKEKGGLVCPPTHGTLACGYSGDGRLAPYHHLEQYLRYALQHKKDLIDKNVLITLGPTREYFDPIRYTSNFSSGKMGLQLALEAFARGAAVTVVAGPVDLPLPVGIEWINVESAEQMAKEVENNFEKCDYYFGAAAVADYRPANISGEKMKKKDEDLTLSLEPTVDILKQCGHNKRNERNKKTKQNKQFVFGFALESKDIIINGLSKMDKKNLDGIIINSAIQKDGGMGSDRNAVVLIKQEGEKKEIENKPKELLSRDIFDFFI